MKRTENINLGGIPFVINVDAYDHLDHYLDAVERQFGNSSDAEEIVHDIEARMAELLQENKKTSNIITLHDIKDVIHTMGMPNELNDQAEFYGYETDESHSIKTGKKIFRDTDNEVVAGVCSGVAAYYGINDPTIVRVIFAVVGISLGIGVLAYIIMWILIPEAKTASDKLSMKGEPINIESIGDYIEKEVEDFAERISDLGSKKKVKKNKHAPYFDPNPQPRGFMN